MKYPLINFLSLALVCAITNLPAAAVEPAAVSKTSSIEIAQRSKYVGELIFIRGGFNVFSRGMDTMSAQLSRRGIDATVARYTETKKIASRIIANQRQYGSKPIVLVGHSWGANEVLRLAQVLKKKGLRISYAATIAPTNPPAAPNNIRKLTNYFFSTGGWGKPVKRSSGFRGRLRNIDLSKNSGVHHFNSDDIPKIQSQILRNVLRVFPPRRRG